MSNFCWGEIRSGEWGQVPVLSGRVCEPFRVSVSYLCDAPSVTFTDTQRCKARRNGTQWIYRLACVSFTCLSVSFQSVFISISVSFLLLAVIVFFFFCCVLIYFRLFITVFFSFFSIYLCRASSFLWHKILYISQTFMKLLLFRKRFYLIAISDHPSPNTLISLSRPLRHDYFYNVDLCSRYLFINRMYLWLISSQTS